MTPQQINAFIDDTYPDNLEQGITAAELRQGLKMIVALSAAADERSRPTTLPVGIWGNPNTYVPPPYTSLDLAHLFYY